MKRKLKITKVSSMGVLRKFFREGGNINVFLVLFKLLAMQCYATKKLPHVTARVTKTCLFGRAATKLLASTGRLIIVAVVPAHRMGKVFSLLRRVSQLLLSTARPH